MDPVITWDSRIFYGTLALIVFFLSHMAERTNKKTFVWALATLLLFVAGFRAYTVGRDTRSYAAMFQLIHRGATSYDLHIEKGVAVKDPGFGLICRVLSFFGNNPTVLLLFCACVIYFPIILRFWELRQRISFSCAAFSFYCVCFFESMNVMRQYCAVAIVFWATRYLSKRKYASFIAMVALATLSFHKSAIISLSYLGIELFSWENLTDRQKKFLKRLIYSGVLFSALIVVFLTSYLKQYAHYYQHANVNIGLRIFALLFIFFASLFLYKFSNRAVISLPSKTQGKEYFLRNVRIYYLLGSTLASIGYVFEFVGRIGYYFTIFWFVYFGLLVQERRQISRWILKALVYAVTLYILYQYLFTSNGAWHHPYRFVWTS